MKNFKKTQWQQDLREGPYRIEKVLKNDNYLLYDQYKKSWKKVNIEVMKLYKERDLKEKIEKNESGKEPQSSVKKSPIKSKVVNTMNPKIGDTLTGEIVFIKSIFSLCLICRLKIENFHPYILYGNCLHCVKSSPKFWSKKNSIFRKCELSKKCH